jgi:rsbT co-antagonist protein RsbR
MVQAATEKTLISSIIRRSGDELLQEWIQEQQKAVAKAGKRDEAEVRQLCSEFLRLFRDALEANGAYDLDGKEWTPVRELLDTLSRERSEQGYSPSETASFVFSLKRPLFAQLRRELIRNPEALAQETWTATEIIDRLGLYTTEVFQRARDAIIARQQEEMLELSTPVVKLWDGILALPMIGTLDSQRTQVVMETLLQGIIDTGSEVAIIDITGVPTVDTLVAQHLLKTVAAARLMGAECIISGIRPQIAQTIVHLGIDLGQVITKATLADAFREALKRAGVQLRPTLAQAS